ncbi:MAG: isocitrate lyase/PEP mutase family protein [Hyphomicrobiales bacterium]|nr:isocitrate lyase/PEP mutase family protein [Hyphomicrobiales bacterium]
MQRIRSLIQQDKLIIAPVALNPLMARLAVETGFKAVYLSGGSQGWITCGTEATITLPEMAQIAVAIRTVTDVPIVLDAGGGWGDPAHIHHTIALTEAAGFDVIEIEDQLLPRRFHHHVGIEHLVEPDFMVKKIAAAVAARRNPDLVIVGRTNALRLESMDAALRRGEAYKKAGADMIFIHTRTPEEMRIIGERLPGPLMIFAPEDGFAEFGIQPDELAKLGYRLAASSGSAFAAMYKAAKQSYQALMNNQIDPFLGSGGAVRAMKEARDTAGLAKYLDIEQTTVGPIKL